MNNLQDIEKLAIIVGCLCHDLDHRGTNNMFQAESHSLLSQLYGTKVKMEKHNFNHCIRILNTPGHNIFAHLKPRTYVTVIKYIKEAILATDLADHFSLVFIFAFKFNLIANLIFFSFKYKKKIRRSNIKSRRLLVRRTLVFSYEKKFNDLL